MKHTVDEIILAFSKQELREFKYFLAKRNTGIQEREDLKLIEHIRSGKNTDIKNINAHHQTRKRLKRQLEQFALIENLRHDEESHLYAQIEMAKYLFRKNLHKQAWEYLINMERKAVQSEYYRLLDYNYDIQIAYSYNVVLSEPSISHVPDMLQKRNDNLPFAMADSNANAAYALLIYELKKQFAEQLTFDIDQLVDEVLSKFNLKDSLFDNDLRIYCKIVNLVCRALREKREYYSLKNYAIGIYKTLKRKRQLEKIAPEFLMDLLDAICVATLRSADYVNCEFFTGLYTQQAKKMLVHSDEYSYYDFIPMIGVNDLCLCTGKIAKAKEIMLNLQKKYARYKESARIYFLLRINLIAVHFSCNEYEKCIKLYNEIQTLHHRKILEEPGFRIELIFFTDIYGIIFHYEDGAHEYALYLLNKVKRKYAVLLRHPDSKREKLFLNILEKMLTSRSYPGSKKIMSDCEECVRIKRFTPGDFEYISMGAWLYAKITGMSYYNCFLGFVVASPPDLSFQQALE